MMYQKSKPIDLYLIRDISKHIKRGNPWVFQDCFLKQNLEEGKLARLFSPKKQFLAWGFTSNSGLSFRAVSLNKVLDHKEIKEKILRALLLRSHLIRENNQVCRLINGEGDELSGLVCDYYNKTVVIKLDGIAAHRFWLIKEISEFLMSQKTIPIESVVYKPHQKLEMKAHQLSGVKKDFTNFEFMENGISYIADLINGAKTGFFIDQRDNRKLIKKLSKDKEVLNLFSYTGGFSLSAAQGGAKKITSVDIAPMAIKDIARNMQLNQFSCIQENICQDVFEWLESSNQTYEIVITDPPSFAPNEKAITNAKAAYEKVFIESIKKVRSCGYFAASSCSAHLSFEDFEQICIEAISKARRRAKVLEIKGQPIDHPYPLALKEMRYLKFFLFQLD